MIALVTAQRGTGDAGVSGAGGGTVGPRALPRAEGERPHALQEGTRRGPRAGQAIRGERPLGEGRFPPRVTREVPEAPRDTGLLWPPGLAAQG